MSFCWKMNGTGHRLPFVLDSPSHLSKTIGSVDSIPVNTIPVSPSNLNTGYSSPSGKFSPRYGMLT